MFVWSSAEIQGAATASQLKDIFQSKHQKNTEADMKGDTSTYPRSTKCHGEGAHAEKQRTG